MIRALLFLLPLSVSAQWEMTADSVLQVPYREAKEAAVERLNVDTIADQLFEEVTERTKAQEASNKELSACDSAKVAALDLYMRCGHDLDLSNQKVAKLEIINASLRGVNKVLILAAAVLTSILILR